MHQKKELVSPKIRDSARNPVVISQRMEPEPEEHRSTTTTGCWIQFFCFVPSPHSGVDEVEAVDAPEDDAEQTPTAPPFCAAASSAFLPSFSTLARRRFLTAHATSATLSSRSAVPHAASAATATAAGGPERRPTSRSGNQTEKKRD